MKDQHTNMYWTYRRVPFWAVLTILLLTACKTKKNNDTITLESLLKEMTDIEQQALYPEPYYSSKQVSSYDRASVSPDSAHWFANNDGFGIERIDTVDGRIEKVLFDEQGPGAITRIWITAVDKNGTWRFYFDGSEQASWTIPAYDMMMFGIESLGPGLIQPHTSYTANGKGGSTLYLPIPYAKRCKVTFEDPKGMEATPKYYHINFRTYGSQVGVETFSKAVVERSMKIIKQTDELLVRPPASPGSYSEVKSKIDRQDSLTFELPKGQHAIHELTFHATISDTNAFAQQMRNLIFKATFDGRETVWCPLSDFSGGGMGGPYVKSWYLAADGKGKVISRWLMPYKGSARLVLHNIGNETVDVRLSANVAPHQWNKRSLYFHTAWKQQTDIPLHNKPEEDDQIEEWNFTTIAGRGVYKGDVLSLFNHSPAWYGEGDEKIWVDNDRFPSHFGTGTEDYYNSSWAPVVPFQTPFGGAPRADQESSHGYNTFFRTRQLDGIPFEKTLRFDIEMLSWIKGTVDYAATVFWYGDIDSKAMQTSKLDQARKTLLPIPKDAGKYYVPESKEFESLRPRSFPEHINLDKQSMYGFPESKWSGAAQLTANGGDPGDALVFDLDNLEAAEYELVIYATQAPDYGILAFEVNGEQVPQLFDGYYEGVRQQRIPLGRFASINGKISLKVKIAGANKRMVGDRHMLGLDCIQMKKI